MRFGRKLSVPPPQPLPPSAEVLALRSNWKWAYLSHFLFTFNPVLHLENIELSELEDDLASGTYSVIPTIMQRLLMSLTPHDKRMILEDWQQQLRKQSMKRSPDDNLMGTEDDPVDFKTLIMTDKLELFYRMCEWQFHNPNSLRTRMRDDDEFANWRIQPIAFDARGNAYWLLGGNRLWKQSLPPQKTVRKSNKRKRAIINPTEAATHVVNGRKISRRELNMTTMSPVPQRTTKARSKAVPLSRSPSSLPNTRTRKPVRDTRSQTAGLSHRPRNIGTRVSSRLRGKEEEWQEIPEEWLQESAIEASEVTGHKRNADSEGGTRSDKEEENEEEKRDAFKLIDDGSELTSLSDLSELHDESEKNDTDEDEYTESDSGEEEGEAGKEVVEGRKESSTPDYSALREEVWETVCVTLQEWEEFPQQFRGSTNSRERAFYKLLVNEIVPAIVEVLKVEIKKQVMEDAIVQRKRSSRLAMKESLREAEEAESRRRAELGKEKERHKRWEARAKKEEEERLKLESMRSARLKEKAGIFTSTNVRNTPEAKVEVVATNGATHPKPVGVTNGTAAHAITGHVRRGSSAKSNTPNPKEEEPWELDCEICHRRGRNLDDGQELMCCEKCNKWQHIRCHDQADFIAGRPRRNWELEEFICSACQTGQQIIPQPLQLKPIEHFPQLHPYSSAGNPTLQLRPSHHQQQQSLYPAYPQTTYVSSQNWVMYGAPGTHLKNGKPISGGGNTGARTAKGKQRINDAYSIATQSTHPIMQSVHGHPYRCPPTTPTTHYPSVPGSSNPTMPAPGMPLNVQAHRLITPSGVSSTSPSSNTAFHSYSSASNISDYSRHYPSSMNPNLSSPQYAPVQRLTSGAVPPPSSMPNVTIPTSPQYPEAWKSFQAVGNFDNAVGKSVPQPYFTAPMTAGGALSNGSHAPPSIVGTTTGFRHGSPVTLPYSGIAPSTGNSQYGPSTTAMHPSPR